MLKFSPSKKNGEKEKERDKNEKSNVSHCQQILCNPSKCLNGHCCFYVWHLNCISFSIFLWKKQGVTENKKGCKLDGPFFEMMPRLQAGIRILVDFLKLLTWHFSPFTLETAGLCMCSPVWICPMSLERNI